MTARDHARMPARWRAVTQRVAVCSWLALLAGCAALLPKPQPPPKVYALQAGPPTASPQPALPPAAALAATAAASAAGLTAAAALAPAGLSLVVALPQADAGFDSTHMVYRRQADQLEYFAHSQWVDTPARMLAPLIVDAAGRAPGIRVALPASAGAAADGRLLARVVRLQQDFSQQPSQVRFTLQLSLLDDATRQVVDSAEFDETVAAPSDDPAGGVAAANQAVQRVLQALSRFCAQAAAHWPPPARAGR